MNNQTDQKEAVEEAYQKFIKEYYKDGVALCEWLRSNSRSITKGVTSKTVAQL